MGSAIVKTFDNIILEEKIKENIRNLSNTNPQYIEYAIYLEKSKVGMKRKYFELKNQDEQDINRI